jgi:hypothetical protein
VAKKTAGKYGVKNTSGRIIESDHRAAVAKARQQAAKPMLKKSDGGDVPCQPRRNSSNNFAMLQITSPDRQIKRMVAQGKMRGRPQALLALFHQAGDIPSSISLKTGRTAWDG